ncbi:MAG: sialate O-acetylesterase [Candidatus Marinimicrobia bacterium]|nr:sialate O-acetylesterase [Candidatus Neomarinimicrobiota bacterium]
MKAILYGIWLAAGLVGWGGALWAQEVATAPLRPAPLFGSNMVLQRDAPVPVWGWAAPGAAVQVTFAGATVTAAADAAGRWQVALPPLPASIEPRALRLHIPNGTEVVYTNVLVGDVWLCSGQSNMRGIMRYNAGDPAELAEAAAADFGLRLLQVPDASDYRPTTGFARPAGWLLASAPTVVRLSAVAYYTGRALPRELDVPIGLVWAAVGNTAIQSWMPRAALEADPASQAALEKFEQDLDTLPRAREEYARLAAQWRADYSQRRREGPAAEAARARLNTPVTDRRPSVLFNGMIAPLTPAALRGVCWYQGESNAGDAEHYAARLTLLIRHWRAAFAQETLPFAIVQLPGYRPMQERPYDSTWATLREAQARVARELPNVTLACTLDVGKQDKIHPPDKRPFGARLAAAILAAFCDQPDIPWQGPTLTGLTRHADAYELEYETGGGSLTTPDGSDAPVRGFAIAGADRRFVPADARIIGPNRIRVHAAAVAEPAALRYGWADFPDVNLYNEVGWPAWPWRTDDWPQTNFPPRAP